MQWTVLWLTVMVHAGLATEVYQWRDADGVLHFEDRPPPVMDAARREIGEPSIVEAWRRAPAERRRAAAPPATSSRALAIEAKRAREEKRAENCHRARQRLAQVRAKRRAGYKASQGRALKQRTRRYQADVRFYCGSWN